MTFHGPEAALFAALVEGGFETPLWATFLERLRRVTGAEYAILSFRAPGRPFEDAITLLSGDAQWKTEDAHRNRCCPLGPAVDDALIAGRPYTLDELLGSLDASEAKAHRDRLALKGVNAIRKMRVHDPSGVEGCLTIARRGADFAAQDCALLTAIAPVLGCVLRQHLMIERERFAASLTAEAVRRLQFGWIMLDRAGRVVDCDEQGAHVLSDSGIFARAANGRLTARPPELEREMLQALNNLADNPLSRPYALTLRRDPWLDMLLVPARRPSVAAKARPAIIAYVHGDNWGSVDRCAQLAELFRLSPREARLALSLCRGMTIAEAASHQGLAEGTARNYSKSIYAKTGARGLPDLVRIVMRSVLAVAPDA